MNCANGDVVGVASDGAELDLPAKAGGTHIKVPKFAFGFADRSLSVAAEITSKGSGSVLDFGSGHIDALNLSYDAENGLRMVATVSVSLPTGQDAKQTLTVHDVVLAKKETRLAFRGVGRIDVPDPFSFAGMQISKRTESDACKLADSPVVAKFNDAKEHLDLMLCATARFPSFLTPKQTQSHVGDLSKPGSAIIPPGDAGVFVNFNGLVIGPDGGLVDDGSPDVKTCPTKQTPRFASDSPEGRLLHDEERESLDCRVEAEIDETIALGALELQEIKVNLVRRLSDQTTVPGRPQFRIVALVKFGKYLSVDGGAFGVINAQFNDHRMVVAGHFSDVVSVRFGAVNAGIRGFSMDFSEQQRSFIAEGGQVSTGGGGVSTTTLYFSEIAFVETRTKNGDFKIAKLRAPVDVKRTGLGLLFRLVTDLGSTSFLHLFKLP